MPRPVRFGLISFIITATVLLLARPAFAAEPFEGLRATAIIGLDRTDSAPGAGARDGLYYGAQIGYDLPAGNFVLGVEADIGTSTASSTVGTTISEQGVFTAAALRIGYRVSDRVLPFVRAGYAYHEVSQSTGPDFSGSGYSVGGGVEAALGNRLFLRGEYRFSDYGSNVRSQQFLGGIGVRF